MTLMTSGLANEAIGADQFGKELSEHLAKLRYSLQRMLTELGSPRTPTLLRNHLGVGYTICWQVFQVVGSEDESGGTHNAPSLGALKRLVIAAQEKGLTPYTAQAVQDAADNFHRFIREHAEDRDYFDSMVAGTNLSANAKGVLVQRRRAAYRANSHVWGSQNDLWLVSGIVRRSVQDPTKMDSIVLSRQQGLRRLRADATAYLMAMKVDLASPNAPSGQDDPLKNALDPAAAAATGMPLVPEFSTDPLPRSAASRPSQDVGCSTGSTMRWACDPVAISLPAPSAAVSPWCWTTADVKSFSTAPFATKLPHFWCWI